MKHSLDLHGFERALSSLQTALTARAEDEENLFIRDSCIQRFEYSYEAAWKILKRYLELTSPDPSEIDLLSFQDLIRKGSEAGLLKNGWDGWRYYRQGRASASYAYSDTKALEVLEVIPNFHADALYLLERLKAKTRIVSERHPLDLIHG